MEHPDPIRADYVIEINRFKSEARKAGPIHKRDLMKHIRRMEKELRDYDRFHREAGGETHAPRNTPQQPCQSGEGPQIHRR